ncbi:MAG: dihydroorotase [Dehalococcoidia bacterium]
MRLLIRGGRLLDPASHLDGELDLLLEDGLIKARRHDLDADGAEVIDARGMLVTPGFVDLHCHLREPGEEHKETIASGAAAAARGGFTTICAMPNTHPPTDSRGLVEALLERGEATTVRVLPIGAVTRALEGKDLADLADMAEAGAVAFSDDGRPIWDAAVMRRALEYGLITGRAVSDHCEDLALSAGGVMNEGWVSARLGLAGIPTAAEEAAVARDIQLCELTGGRLHIAHVSTRGSVELVRRAKERGLPVSAEVTPHHLVLVDEAVMGGVEAMGEALAYDTNARVNPPLRSRADVEACVEGLRDGVIDCIATDHAPHAEEDKLCEFDHAANGISGFETAFALCNSLVASGWAPIETLVERMTSGAARAFALDERFPGLGTLADGAPADVTIIDLGETWVVDRAAFASRGRNTPLAGQTLTGRVKATIGGGKIAWSELRQEVPVG